jgi:hypothetical protein
MSEGEVRRPLRRMGIRDLLLLTLLESAALALAAPQFRLIQAMPLEAFRSSRLLALAPPTLDHLSMGLVLFGLVVLARDRWRGNRFAWSPGHWYFLVMGPVAVYLPLGEYLQQQATGSVLWAHYALLVAVYGTAAVIAVCSVFRTRPLLWRAVPSLLAVSLVLVATLAVQRLAEMHGNGGFQPYRLRVIAGWVTTSIALSATAWTALIADSLRARWHDWLTVLTVVAMTLNAISIGVAFWPILARIWRDFYSFILAIFAWY